MKRFSILCATLFLVSCGSIGIGSNHSTNVYNNSSNPINLTSDSGVYKIKPNSSLQIYSSNNIDIKSQKKVCSQTTIAREPNVAAIILDVFPGLFIGILPILVDAVTNNLYRMPETYSYSCDL